MNFVEVTAYRQTHKYDSGTQVNTFTWTSKTVHVEQTGIVVEEVGDLSAWSPPVTLKGLVYANNYPSFYVTQADLNDLIDEGGLL